MTLAPTTTVRQSERIAARVIDGKAVVIVLDAHRLHTLNEVGTRVWELADGRSLASIADALAADFEVDRETALADATRFVAELQALGAIDLEPPERATR